VGGTATSMAPAGTQTEYTKAHTKPCTAPHLVLEVLAQATGVGVVELDEAVRAAAGQAEPVGAEARRLGAAVLAKLYLRARGRTRMCNVHDAVVISRVHVSSRLVHCNEGSQSGFQVSGRQGTCAFHKHKSIQAVVCKEVKASVDPNAGSGEQTSDKCKLGPEVVPAPTVSIRCCNEDWCIMRG
jgi:hypothetical protein